jgi:hypothetical protein
MYKYLLTPLLLFMMQGCSQKIVVRAIEPAEVDRATHTRKISVADFTYDDVGLANKIETTLLNQKFDNKNYFTLISRRDFNKIVAEQRLQSSGLIESSTAVQVGSLIGAEAIISGHVTDASSRDTHYYEERYSCVDRKCKEKVVYAVSCVRRSVLVSADIRMVDVEKGDIIYADTLSRGSKWSHCRGDYGSLPSEGAALQILAEDIAVDFARKITPHYRYFEVFLLEKPDISYSDEAEQLLESSVEYIKQGRYDKAEKLLIELVDLTAQKSYVPFYNLGVIKEAQGDYREAKKYYEMSDNLAKEPVKEIDRAYLRIQELIDKNTRVKNQLQ